MRGLTAVVTTGLLVGLLFAGCATVAFVPTAPPRPPLPENAVVKVFLMERPSMPYEELGMIEVSAEDAGERLEVAQKEARRRGANALFLLNSEAVVRNEPGKRELKTRDADGNVVATQEVPTVETRVSHYDRFAALLVFQPTAAAVNSEAPRPR